MKKSITLLLAFLTCTICFSQNKTLTYKFKYAYYIYEDYKNKERTYVPTGSDVTITYDTFFKKYFVLWTDSKNIRAGNNFYYIPSNDENGITSASDDNGNYYYIVDKIKDYSKLFITMKKQTHNFMVTILLTDELITN